MSGFRKHQVDFYYNLSFCLYISGGGNPGVVLQGDPSQTLELPPYIAFLSQAFERG